MKLNAVWKMEPGDGTGKSIADAMIRNEKGLCAICDNTILPESICYGIFCKLCPICEKEILEALDKL